MYSLFALIEHILRLKDGHTLLATPDLDESSMDQASLALGQAALALALQAPALPARSRRAP